MVFSSHNGFYFKGLLCNPFRRLLSSETRRISSILIIQQILGINYAEQEGVCNHERRHGFDLAFLHNSDLIYSSTHLWVFELHS